jgi:hypothetical protein
MTEPGDGVAQPGDITSSDQRLYRFERAGRWLLFGCIGLFILESAFDAHDSPGTLGQALLDWPNNFFAALAMACVAAGVPFAGVRSVGARVAALVVLYCSVVLVGGLLGFLVFYTVAMSGFD